MQNARTGGDFCISIHALREEGDNPIRRKQRRPFPISIHALREEGDRRRPRQRPVGGISIHALREEGDRAKIQPVVLDLLFLSTPSARRAT